MLKLQHPAMSNLCFEERGCVLKMKRLREVVAVWVWVSMTPGNQGRQALRWGQGRTQESYELEVKYQARINQTAPVSLYCCSLLLMTLAAPDLLRGAHSNSKSQNNKLVGRRRTTYTKYRRMKCKTGQLLCSGN